MPLFVAASLALHAAILGPLALGSLGIEVKPPWSGPHPDPFLPIDVVLVRPRLPGEPSRGRVTPVSPPAGRFIPTPVREIGPADEDALFRSGAIGILTPKNSPASSIRSIDRGATSEPIDGIADTWRVRPGLDGPAAGVPGPVLSCRRTELLPPIEREICAARFAAAADARATARLGQRRLTRTESVREDGFAEQAAANAAWSAYRRSEDDGQSYPGLRSMLKHF